MMYTLYITKAAVCDDIRHGVAHITAKSGDEKITLAMPLCELRIMTAGFAKVIKAHDDAGKIVPLNQKR